MREAEAYSECQFPVVTGDLACLEDGAHKCFSESHDRVRVSLYGNEDIADFDKSITAGFYFPCLQT